MPDDIADDVAGPAGVLEWGEPVGIGFYPDLALRAELIVRLRSLATPRPTHVVRTGVDALRWVDEDCLVIVTPEDERTTVLYFDQNRDHFCDVKASFLILLLRGGSGENALGDAISLASFARDASFEVKSGPTVEEARATFIKVHGVTSDEWLRQWRASELHDTLENNSILSDALALEDAK